jgi:hypothetical protein
MTWPIALVNCGAYLLQVAVHIARGSGDELAEVFDVVALMLTRDDRLEGVGVDNMEQSLALGVGPADQNPEDKLLECPWLGKQSILLRGWQPFPGSVSSRHTRGISPAQSVCLAAELEGLRRQQHSLQGSRSRHEQVPSFRQ